jgi:hypothetical protein
VGEDALKHTFVCLAVLAVVGSCGPSTGEVLTVDTVVGHLQQLDGKTVRVSGYLPTCGRLDCTLYNNKREADLYALAAKQQVSKLPNFLAIGPNEKFDTKAGPLAGQYVVVTGTITKECRAMDNAFACPDRGPDIKPIDIRVALGGKHSS